MVITVPTASARQAPAGLLQDAAGGAAAGARNLVSGNQNVGITIETSGNAGLSNNIGTDASFTGPLGNGTEGLRLTGSDTIVAGNVIAFNSGNGITASGTGHAILLNSISDNGGLGIDQGGTA